jgi:hypothetical protein
MHINQVTSFSYHGTIVNGNDTLEEEIRNRIAKWNKAFYANKILFKSNLVSRKSKLKLYCQFMLENHGSLKKGLYKNSPYLKEKYYGKYLDQIKKSTEFGELKQTRSWMN